MVTCGSAAALVAGTLTHDQAEAFRGHVGSCEPCQIDLEAAMIAHIESLTPLTGSTLDPEQIVDAVDQHLVPWSVGWDAFGPAGPRQDRARQAIAEAINAATGRP